MRAVAAASEVRIIDLPKTKHGKSGYVQANRSGPIPGEEQHSGDLLTKSLRRTMRPLHITVTPINPTKQELIRKTVALSQYRIDAKRTNGNEHN